MLRSRPVERPTPKERQRYVCKGGGVIVVCAVAGETIHYLYIPPGSGRVMRDPGIEPDDQHRVDIRFGLQPGTRVWCQAIDEDTGQFGKVDKGDRGTVELDCYEVGDVRHACLVVVWDNWQTGAEGPDIDVITETGRAVEWPYQVLGIPASVLAS